MSMIEKPAGVMLTTDGEGAVRVSHHWRTGHAVLNCSLRHCYLYVENNGKVLCCPQFWRLRRTRPTSQGRER